MNKQKWAMLAVALAIIAVAAASLVQLRTHQKLGAPGVKTEPLDDPIRVQVLLPEQVLNYKSELVEVDDLTRTTLPADTSFGQRKYAAPDGFVLAMNVVLMGKDRTSLRKPQFCLTGAGWNIDSNASAEDAVEVPGPQPYKLPVVKLISNREVTHNGQTQLARGVYVYWFVADNAVSASVSGFERMWYMAKHMMQTGVLQRWAYVSCFAVCAPGQEEATYARMKEFIAASVPEFQQTPAPQQTVVVRN